MPKHCPPLPIDFTSGMHPTPRSLNTGDLLFPRCPGFPEAAGTASGNLLESLSGREREMPLRDFLGPALTLQLVSGGDAQLLERLAARPADAAVAERREDRDERGAFAPERVALLLAILRLEFADLFDEWFDMSVDRFLDHPLAQVLLQALNGDLSSGFFIGHCALVLREEDGHHSDDPDAPLWVIEANATSFSRYGVTAHPYHIDGDGADGSGHHRSWLGQRAARGDAVWRARPPALDEGGNAALARRIREAIVPAARRYLGRSYSFFDSPRFADDARLYCSEFVYRVLDDVRTGLPPHELPADTGDCRRWGWMRDHNPPGSPIGNAIAAALADPRLRDYLFPPAHDPAHHPLGRNFFIFTVQMLWRSANLLRLNRPLGKEYDAP